MELQQIVKDVYPVSEEGIVQLLEMLTPVKFRRGSLLIEQGKVCTDVYIIKSGRLRNFALNDGEEDTRWFATDGDFVASLFSIYEKKPSIASVEALSAVEGWKISAEALIRLMEQSHEWSVWFNHLFIGGLFMSERKYTYMGHGDASARYSNFLKMRPRGFHEKIQLKHIASYLNITPQSLSRVRNKSAKR